MWPFDRRKNGAKTQVRIDEKLHELEQLTRELESRVNRIIQEDQRAQRAVKRHG